MMGLNKDADASMNDVNLVNQNEFPGDTVSSIAWAPTTNMRMFACADWGSKIRLYEPVIQSMQQKGIVQKACLDVDDPCLSVNWSDDCTKIFAGCINNTVKVFDTNTGQSATVGQHDAGVKDVHWIPGANTLCTLSFDKTMRFWDVRQSGQAVAGYNLGLKAFCSDLYVNNNNMYMVIGLQDEKILVVNIPNIQQMMNKNPLDYIDSPLGQGSQITAIGFYSDGSGIGVASHDGRANLSKLDQDGMGKIKLANVMTFKAHKTEQQGSQPQMLYPVHAIGFHPKSKNYVFTAGGEGNIFFWDYGQKNKITGFNYKGVPVTRAKMSPDGSLLAYSLGYDWAKGIEGYMSHKPKICCHIMQENELVYSGK